MNENTPRYFTPKEIDQLIPTLEIVLSHIAMCKARAAELTAKIIPARRTEFSQDWVERQLVHSQIDFLMGAVQDDVQQILALGGVPKDLEQGLIDFLGEVHGRDVWMCWQKGESHVSYWHSLDSGFSQRRALPSSEPSSALH